VAATVVASQGGVDVTSTGTDQNGRYALMGLVPGDYTVAVSMPAGFASDSVSVTVAAAQEVAGTDFLLAETP
jgi:hypothetical protein